MTLEGRIKRLEREWDHPANPGPDPETVAHWASLWIDAGMEESQSTALALEFLEYCQATGQEVAWSTLLTREKGGRMATDQEKVAGPLFTEGNQEPLP